MTGLREGWGVKVWTLGGLEVWTGLTLRGYHKGHKGDEEGGPGACRAWRASHATLWGGETADCADFGQIYGRASARRTASVGWKLGDL